MVTFDLFVTTLDPWEAELLSHVTLSVDPYSLCLELTPGFRAVSDGSVQLQRHGSFGWVLSTLRGERLATGMGPARGRLPQSYRAEAYGMLSLLRFLLRIKEFTVMHEPWVGILATDSQSVLDTLQEGDHDPQEQDVPVDLDRGEVVLDCLRPDWDILIEKQSALKRLPRVSLQYVKGHQDRTTPYTALDLMGQLNVDADKQAEIYNLELRAYRGFAHMLPLTCAHLQLPDGTVTGRYPDELLNEATTKPLLEYIRIMSISGSRTVGMHILSSPFIGTLTHSRSNGLQPLILMWSNTCTKCYPPTHWQTNSTEALANVLSADRSTKTSFISSVARLLPERNGAQFS